MAREKNFFDAQFEIELLNLQMRQSEKEQRQLNILFVAIGIILTIGLGLCYAENKKLQESVNIINCQSEAKELGTSFYISDGDCNLVYVD